MFTVQVRVTKRMVRKLDLGTLGREALKVLHILLTDEKVFGRKTDILEKTREAVENFLAG